MGNHRDGGEMQHLVELADDWCVWRWFLLRGAGFPVDLLAPLSSPTTVAAVDDACDHEATVTSARARATHACEVLLARQRPEARKPFSQLLRRLNRGQSVDPREHDAELRDSLEALQHAESALAESRERASIEFSSEQRRISAELRVLARNALLQEAVLWQNRGAFHRAIRAVRDEREAKPSRTRDREHVLARYLQRYCTKNETIGFFGPNAWSTFDNNDGAASLEIGGALLSARRVYFEPWVIVALADLATGDPILRSQLKPRISSLFRIDQGQVFQARGNVVSLPAGVVKLLTLSDGTRSAREIAAVVAADPDSELADEMEAHEMLEELAEKRLIAWSVDVPFDAEHPEQDLRQLLQPLEGARRDQLLGLLDELEARRALVSSAAGDPEALDRALGELDACFEQGTGGMATRRSGQSFAGRTLVFEECARDVTLRLGPAFLASWAKPMSLLLQSARWLSFEVASRVRADLVRAYEDLRAETGSATIELARLLERMPSLMTGLKSSEQDVVGDVLSAMHMKWRQVLELRDGDTLVQRSSHELTSRVREAFAAPHPGWPAARHHSIDILIGARTFDELRTGGGMVVLGEMQPCGAQVIAPAWGRFCPRREDVYRAYRKGTATAQVKIPPSKQHATHASCGPWYAHEFWLDVGMQRQSTSSSQRLAPADLVVERRDGSLIVRTRDGLVQLDIVTFCETWLIDAVAGRCSILGRSDWGLFPRVVIDNLVVHRQMWSMTPEQVPFLALTSGVEQFAAARRWARTIGLPRWCFLKVPEETKPIFVDFESPLFVDVAAKLARRATKLTFSEMLPAPPDLWLPDIHGNRYTSELRLTAVDPVAFPTAPSDT
jgi:hypothetical protein